jgi:hypothetical protein
MVQATEMKQLNSILCLAVPALEFASASLVQPLLRIERWRGPMLGSFMAFRVIVVIERGQA